MYVGAGLAQVAALDARAGEQLWLYDLGVYDRGRPANTAEMHNRRLTYWSNGDVERLFVGTYDGCLLAVDAVTGRPAASFGENGLADLETTWEKESWRYTLDRR